MEIPQTFATDRDPAAATLFEQQQRDLNKYQTRYVYLPFRDGTCYQIPRGFAPMGVIHPIPSPRGICNVRMLPEGAQTLQVISPSTGIPGPSRTKHKDPELELLYAEIERLKQIALDRGSEPASLAVYLHEVEPVVSSLVSMHAKEGAIEIKTLAGVPERAFEQHHMNDHLFGEGEHPATAKAIRDRMQEVIERAGRQKGEASRILNAVAGEILKSVSTCEQFCKEHVRTRHLEMDDPQNDSPKRYSQRDQRAIEFIGAVRREEYMQHVAEQQQAAMAAIPRMLEAQERREQQWATTFAEMTKLMTAQTEALKAISGKQSK